MGAVENVKKGPFKADTPAEPEKPSGIAADGEITGQELVDAGKDKAISAVEDKVKGAVEDKIKQGFVAADKKLQESMTGKKTGEDAGEDAGEAAEGAGDTI